MDWLMQERRNSIADALELNLSYINPSIFYLFRAVNTFHIPGRLLWESTARALAKRLVAASCIIVVYQGKTFRVNYGGPLQWEYCVG